MADAKEMELLAEDVRLHLRNPYMPGKPHIGVLGPRPDSTPTEGNESDLVVDSEDASTTTDSEDPSMDPQWRFVPNKAVCSFSLRPEGKEATVVKVHFAIRLDEGCENDLADFCAPLGRPAEGQLTMADLRASIVYYDVVARILHGSKAPSGEVHRDGGPASGSEVKVKNEPSLQEVLFRIKDQSRPFLTYADKAPVVHAQHYDVTVRIQATKKSADLYQVDVRVVNDSPWSAMSRLPKIGRGDDGKSETKKAVIEKLRGKKGSKVSAGFEPRLWEIEGAASNASGNNFGYLMDFLVEAEVASRIKPYDDKDAARTVNLINSGGPREQAALWKGRLSFEDSAVFKEEIPRMAPGRSTSEVLKDLGVSESIRQVFEADKQWGSFYRFQERGMAEIFDAMRKRQKDAVILAARTASGKTEAFAIPIAEYCIQRIGELGTKAIIFYPTKALSNDQANRFIDLLFHLNKRLRAQGARPITIGILHGDVAKFPPEKPEDATDLPLACPASPGGNACPGRLQGEGDHSVKCETCNAVLDYVFITSRRSIYSNPPDILITNPDTMTWDLLARPWQHTPLGRPTWACSRCGRTYLAIGVKKKCEDQGCGGSLTQLKPCLPGIVVFDEIHLVKGAFGINTSLFLSRLQAVISDYARRYHDNKDWRMVLVGSTATISNAESFAKDFFHLSKSRIAVVPANDAERASFYVPGAGDDSVTRFHLACLPYAYQGDSTVAKAIQYMQARQLKGEPPARVQRDGTVTKARGASGRPLQVLTFVNNIRTSNSLIAATRRGLSADQVPVEVDGHTTDFDRAERASTERRFNKGETNVLFATSTLEVGVDFRRIDVVVPYGMPYSFNDYLQRIGRCGRRADGFVFTVCQNWKPVDHYFFVNLKQNLEDPHKSVEPVPITRENIEAIKRHAKCAVMDYLSCHEKVPTWQADLRKLPVGGGGIPREEFMAWVNQTLSVPQFYKAEVDASTSTFLRELGEAKEGRLQPIDVYVWFWSELNERHQLTNMRSTDPEVMVEIIQ